MSRSLDLLAVPKLRDSAVRIWRSDWDAVTLGVLQGHEIASGAFVWQARNLCATDDSQYLRFVGDSFVHLFVR
jgi:hypothetical protein